MFDLSSQEEKFPFKFASRLNSMKDRPDLWMGEPGVVGWIKRQGQIKGLDLIDFNYPQHITSPKVDPINTPCNEPYQPTFHTPADIYSDACPTLSHSLPPTHHVPKVTPAALAEIKDAMVAAGLQCGAICLRFPKVS